VKRAEIYVQTSRFEGKSRAIEEAKIHKKPIVITNYPSVNDQITHGENGYIVEMNPHSLANGIVHLFTNSEVKNKLISNLQHVKNINEQQINVLYHIID